VKYFKWENSIGIGKIFGLHGGHYSIVYFFEEFTKMMKKFFKNQKMMIAYLERNCFEI